MTEQERQRGRDVVEVQMFNVQCSTLCGIQILIYYVMRLVWFGWKGDVGETVVVYHWCAEYCTECKMKM